MSDHPSTASSVWPLPSFRFELSWGAMSAIPFEEVIGLEQETQIIEYRHSNRSVYSPIKMPGIAKLGQVTLKKGIFAGDSAFWTWQSEIAMNTIVRRTAVVRLLDANARPVMTWTLANAWPTKISGPILKSDGSEIAIESLELTHEGMTIATH